MTRRQRNIAVEARADLILAEEPSVKAYSAYFETQMHRGKVRRLLATVSLWFVRAGPILTGLGHTDIQRGPPPVLQDTCPVDGVADHSDNPSQASGGRGQAPGGVTCGAGTGSRSRSG
jgi:hypothetical protein